MPVAGEASDNHSRLPDHAGTAWPFPWSCNGEAAPALVSKRGEFASCSGARPASSLRSRSRPDARNRSRFSH
jgi:hypothetical protein